MIRKCLLKGLARVSAVAVAAVALAGHAGTAGAAPAGDAPLKIGIIGAGHIGGTLARLWVAAGHEVLISSRHPEELRPLAQSLGPKARVGTPREAALFGDVVLESVPYGALPQIGRDLKAELAGKMVLDTGNPYPQRDGDMALEARRVGTGVASPRYLPGVRLVRAFNAINSDDLASKAHRPGEPIAIPLAGDDPEALAGRSCNPSSTFDIRLRAIISRRFFLMPMALFVFIRDHSRLARLRLFSSRQLRGFARLIMGLEGFRECLIDFVRPTSIVSDDFISNLAHANSSYSIADRYYTPSRNRGCRL